VGLPNFLIVAFSRLSLAIAAHDLTEADSLNDASGEIIVGVQFKRQRAVTRKRGGERVEEGGESWRRGLNRASGGVVLTTSPLRLIWGVCRP
jgi:hypothetical protein